MTAITYSEDYNPYFETALFIARAIPIPPAEANNEILASISIRAFAYGQTIGYLLGIDGKLEPWQEVYVKNVARARRYARINA